MKPRQLVENLWSRARQASPRRPEPLPAFNEGRMDLIDHPELAYLNQNYSKAASLEPSPARGEGRLQRGVEAAVARGVEDVMRRYLQREEEFLGHLVRFQNQISRHVDDLGRYAGDLAERVDLLSAAVEEVRAIAERSEALHGLLEERLAEGPRTPESESQ